MFVKDDAGSLVNLDLIQAVEMKEPKNNKSAVYAYLTRPIEHELSKETKRGKFFLYFGTVEQCQAYMTELEKELKAYGKLILVEVKPEIKCTCGNGGKPVWEHAENCPVYAPF